MIWKRIVRVWYGGLGWRRRIRFKATFSLFTFVGMILNFAGQGEFVTGFILVVIGVIGEVCMIRAFSDLADVSSLHVN